MGGDNSQKLLPWGGISLLSRAEQASGSRLNQHSICPGVVVPAPRGLGLQDNGLFSGR
jgi:hypothetical protein